MDGTELWEDEDGLVLASEALRALGRPGPPSFVFLNLMEAHLPYAPPRRVLERGLAGTALEPAALLRVDQDPLRDLRPGFRWDAEELAALRTLYAAEVSYVDGLLGRVLGRLREAGRLDSTVVAVVSDHGENLGEHPPLDHQLGLWESLIHVPLLVHVPGAPAGEDDRLVSLADLAPAIEAWAAGVPGPLDGPPAREAVVLAYDLPRPILDRIRERLRLDPAPWARSLVGIRARTGKWVEGSDGTTAAGEGDLAADPALREQLAAWRAALPRRSPSRPAAEPAPDTLERLRGLGYVK